MIRKYSYESRKSVDIKPLWKLFQLEIHSSEMISFFRNLMKRGIALWAVLTQPQRGNKQKHYNTFSAFFWCSNFESSFFYLFIYLLLEARGICLVPWTPSFGHFVQHILTQSFLSTHLYSCRGWLVTIWFTTVCVRLHPHRVVVYSIQFVRPVSTKCIAKYWKIRWPIHDHIENSVHGFARYPTFVWTRLRPCFFWLTSEEQLVSNTI